MNANKRHVVGFLGSVLGAAVLSGVALAGNPHGEIADIGYNSHFTPP